MKNCCETMATQLCWILAPASCRLRKLSWSHWGKLFDYDMFFFVPVISHFFTCINNYVETWMAACGKHTGKLLPSFTPTCCECMGPHTAAAIQTLVSNKDCESLCQTLGVKTYGSGTGLNEIPYTCHSTLHQVYEQANTSTKGRWS